MDSSESFCSETRFHRASNFLRRKKWVNVIPFLMGEQANLLTSSIVDWLGDGREAGDKGKVPKQRFIWLSPLHSSLLSVSWEADCSCCWIILMSGILQLSVLSISLCLLLPWKALLPCFWRLLCLLRCTWFYFDALSFRKLQRRVPWPCQCVANLPGCGW